MQSNHLILGSSLLALVLCALPYGCSGKSVETSDGSTAGKTGNCNCADGSAVPHQDGSAHGDGYVNHGDGSIGNQGDGSGFGGFVNHGDGSGFSDGIVNHGDGGVPDPNTGDGAGDGWDNFLDGDNGQVQGDGWNDTADGSPG